MRITAISLCTLLSIAAAPTIIAWTTPLSTSTQRSKSSLSVGQGWDNDDFLNSLSADPNERERVTEDYYAQSRFGKDLVNMPPPPPDDDEIPLDGTKGAVITEEMKQRIKEQNEKDESQGGTMFKELLQKAQQRQAQGGSFSGAASPNNMPSGMTVEPYQPQAASPVQSDASSAAAISPDALAGLTVEQQAELFRSMIAGNQQQQQPSPQGIPSRNTPGNFPQAFPPQGAVLAPDGRRVGRNRDADQIQNSADLYFAQLKRDSAIRKEAWLAGDAQKANAVFEDPSIKEIEERVNPYLEERKRLDQGAVETSMDEMLKPEYLAPSKPVPLDYSGISYKEKMKQMRERTMANQGSEAATSTSSGNAAAAETSAPSTQQFRVAPTPAAPASEAQAPVASTPPQQQQQTNTPSANPAPPSEDDKRSDIRTLMGLLLKHRGGPGFGAGRLKGDEIDLFKNLSTVLVQVLKEEGVSVPAAVSATQSAPQSMGQGAGDAATNTKVNSLIVVLEGAITMYKNSPAELQPSVLGVLRAALASAVSSLDAIVGGDSTSRPSVAASTTVGQSSSERVGSMIACIEAACQVYKNSPPELQQPVLVTLRAAFVSAEKTLGNIIEGPEQQASAATERAPEASAPVKRLSGNDENTQFLEGVYAKLQAAAGDDKLGLRKGMTSEEAADLADSIAEMRARLVEELDTSIPE
ncbi:hypothetical protein MPSEU_000832000 [Mayamaea pseudoterrestris]|nr:hypothetical protein MPSEU_000832000 [Mayamaea pseudoterrestris]